MKKKLYYYFIITCFFLFTLLPACHKNDSPPVVSPSPDSSSSITFRDSHALTTPNPCVLYDVTVDKIFNSTYTHSFSYECLIVECKVENIFYQAPSLDQGQNWASNGDSILVWIDVTHYETDVVSALRDLLESLDSAVIYGYQLEQHIFQDSDDLGEWENELGKDNMVFTRYYDGRYLLDLPPSVIIHNLTSWPILPIIGGKFDADSITSIFDPGAMAYDFNNEFPDGLQYFKNGDSLADVYHALNKFVSNYKEGA